MELQMLLNTIKNMVETDVKVDVQMVQKGNRTLTGISIGKEDIRAMVYMENYEDLFNEEGYIAVARDMIEICKEANGKYFFNKEEITTWDYAKEHLVLCIAPAGTNNGFVTIPYLDLELYFRVEVSEEGTYKVKEEILGMWNVTKEDILRIALETNEYFATSMKDTMLEILTKQNAPDYMIAEMMDSVAINQIVLTNQSKLFGAAAIYKTDMLKEIADEYENDLYIIPSSIHELIVTPKEKMSVEEMSAFIKETNETQVDPEDRLSDHVYIFNRDTMKIEW